MEATILMHSDTDIDLDLTDPAAALAGLDCVFATDTTGKKHASGVYFQDIPIDPLSGMAVWDQAEAQRRGYFKLDFLRSHMYDGVRDEAHLVDLMMREPAWELFLDENVVRRLNHIRNHHEVVARVQPRSILDVAVCLALIRPGKRHLLSRSRPDIDAEIWLPTEKFNFRKSHAISYAAAIVVQLNLIAENEKKCGTES